MIINTSNNFLLAGKRNPGYYLLYGNDTNIYDAIIKKYSALYNVPPYIIKAIIKKESEFNPKANGDRGNSVGLMQLNFGAGTPQSLGFKNKQALFNPDPNIHAGTKYLAYQISRYGDWKKAISAYNAGSYTTRNYNSYVKDVLKYIEVFKKDFESVPNKINIIPQKNTESVKSNYAVPALIAGAAALITLIALK